MFNITSKFVNMKLQAFSIVSLFLLLFLVAASSSSERLSNKRRLTDEEIRDLIDQFANDVIECTRTPALSLSVVRGDEVFMAKGYGVKDEVSQEPMTNRTMVIIASVTKAFVATTVAVALDDSNGQYSWNTKVKDVLGDNFQLSDPIRREQIDIRDLLSHRTGLPRNDQMRLREYTEDEMIRRMRHLEFVVDYRGVTNYNNLMYGVAGRVVEELSGQHWEDLARDRLFDPLHMTDTTFAHRAEDRWDEFATAYRNSGGNNRPMSLEVAKAYYATFSSPGAVSSNAVDMAQWMMFQLSGGQDPAGEQLLDPQLLEDTHTGAGVIGGSSSIERPSSPVTRSLNIRALGWGEGHYRGFPISSHTGSQAGYLSIITLLPSSNLGVFISQTGPASNARDYLTLYILDLLLGEEPWLDRSDICTQDEETPTDPCFLDCLPEEMASKVSEKLQNLPNSHRIQQDYEGQYGNYAYGDVFIYYNQSSDQLEMSYGPTGWWALTEITEGVLQASGLGIHWSLSFTLVFDEDFESFQISFDAETPPVFIRGLDVDDEPEPPEFC